MKSKTEMIEDAIERQARRLERLEELYSGGEIDMYAYDHSVDEALNDLAELEQELDEYLRREDIERNQSGSPDLDEVSGGRS